MLEEVREYCLSKKGSEESFPFDETTLVFKVGGKMFALLSLNPPFFCNLKCDPEYALELREKHEEITPGYHMSKKHWNSVSLEGNLSEKFVFELIDQSYNLIFNKLPKKVRENI